MFRLFIVKGVGVLFAGEAIMGKLRWPIYLSYRLDDLRKMKKGAYIASKGVG